MKFVSFVRVCFSAICFAVLSHYAVAQDSVFTAKQGIAAARQAANDSGYPSSHLVSIHMIWNMKEGTYNVIEQFNRKVWNGLSKTWSYTFFQPQDSSYHTFQIVSSNDSLASNKVDSPENVDTAAIADGWIDSDEFTKAEKGKEKCEEIREQFSEFEDWNS